MTTSYIGNRNKWAVFYSLIFLISCLSLTVNGQYLKKIDSISKIFPLLQGDRLSEHTTGSVNLLKGSELTTTPTAFYKNALTGRLAGLNIVNDSGQPGEDNPSLSFRGRTPLILIDGIPRTLEGIDPSEIASVTLLKDAVSTALLGNRGASGALLITTKTGKNINGYNFNIKTQTGVTSNLKQRKILSSGDYATLFNEALVNDGRAPIFTDAQIQAYKSGSDPYSYPNINWQNEIFNNNGSFSRVNLNSSGGDDKTTYFLSLDYLDQQGGLVTTSDNNADTQPNYNRFVFKTNLDVALTQSLQGTINLYASNSIQNQPGSGVTSIYNAILNTPSLAYPIFNPDSARTLAGNQTFSNNIYGQAVRSGYSLNKNNDGFADFTLKQSLDKLTKGLWLKTRGSFYYNTVQVLDRNKSFQRRQLIINPSTQDTTYKSYGNDSQQSNSNSVSRRVQDFYFEGSAGYSHLSANNSKLDLMLLYSFQNFRNGGQLPQKYNTAGFDVTYAINGKYVIEGVLSYSGNSWFKPGKQYDLYPAGGLAWNMDQEDFFNKNGFINKLKLKASYGKTGNASASYFGYQDTYHQNSVGYYYGTGPTLTGGIEEDGLPVATRASSAYKLDAGLEIEFAKSKGSFLLDYYRNDLKGLLQVRGNNTSLIGINYPSENIRDISYSGVELTTGWADRIGDLGYAIGGVISLMKSENLNIDEPNMPFPWMQKTGQRVDQIYGYVADGYVQTAGQGPVVEGYTSVPGDIKYKDLNNDGVINQYDVKGLRNDNPFITYGVNFSLNYKNFDISALFQGVGNRSQLVTGELGEWAFRNDGKGNAFEQQLNRWTPSTASTAIYPRLSIGANINNNVNSSYWIQKLDYLRLKNVEVGYSFNGQFLNKIKVSSIRVFINGYNLVTFSDVTRFDPESLSLAYPLQRVINGGLTVKF
jgi:TonB-linked SusC/RagA family outer membrane protein